jgi:hypothetical protein
MTTSSPSPEIDPEIAEKRRRDRERISQRLKTERASITDPDDPEAVPAFETSIGLSPTSNGQKPVVVNAQALENFNRNVSPAVLKHQLEAANVAALFSKRAIRPDEIAAMRRRMFNVVNTSLNDVEQVLSGQKQWNNTQVRLFSILTERVMPKLTSITVDDNSSKKLEDLSLEELEEIAMGKKKATAVDAIVKQGAGLEAEAERREAAEFDASTDAKLAEVASLAQAEQEFVKRQTQPEVAEEGVLKKRGHTSGSSPKRRKPTSPKA